VRPGSAQLGCGVAQLRCGVAQIGRGVAQIGRGVAQLGCVVAQLGCGVAQLGCGGGSLGCGVAQLIARRLAVRRARVRILTRHPREVSSTELFSYGKKKSGIQAETRFIGVKFTAIEKPAKFHLKN
jgi:hypothetical protein